MASRTTEFDSTRGSGESRRVLSASTLEGDQIRNSAGDDLGKLEEIMLDVTKGRVAYAVLSFGGFLGIGSKLFAIPWEALKLDEKNHGFILDVDRERLENAPGFDKDNWPNMADPAFGSNIYNYYGYRPYWDTTTSTTGTDNLDRIESERSFDRDRNRTLKGGGGAF